MISHGNGTPPSGALGEDATLLLRILETRGKYPGPKIEDMQGLLAMGHDRHVAALGELVAAGKVEAR